MSKNFKYLDDLIHSGAKEIVLDSDIVFGDGEVYGYGDGIKLDVDDLVIDGNGHTIYAQEKTRIFYCTGKNITIKNITLKNGFIKGSGGAIHNTGEIKITESALHDNMAEYNGGAIENNGSVTIAESTLKNNTAENGGAIHNYNEKSFNIKNCKLENNEPNDIDYKKDN